MNNIIYNPNKQSYHLTYVCKNCGIKHAIRVRSRVIGEKHKGFCVSCAAKKRASKRVVLKNLVTGEVKKAKSITQFCDEVGLGGNAKYHFSDVLTGKRLHYKCWGLNIGWIVDQDDVRRVTQFQIKQATE